MISMGGTQHQQIVAGICILVEMDFTSGTIYYTNSPLNITIGGHTYQGLGALVGVSDLNESMDSDEEKLTLSLSIVNTAMIATVLGSVESYRGRRARIYFLMMTADFIPVNSPIQRWTGYMDKVIVNRSPANADGGNDSSGTIEMQCSRAGMARARNYQGLRLTHQQQILRYPSDTGLRYIRTLIDQPATWLSKDFQKQ